jgi:hypothetical protein
VSSQIVTYQVDESTAVSFEIEPADGFRPAGPGQVIGKIGDAIAPAVEAARTVLDKVREIRPDEVELTFGIKVSGGANWLIARSAGEANFEVKLTWSPKETPNDHSGEPTTAIQGQDASEPSPESPTKK